MAEIDIDFGRAAMLMEVVQKVASVAPAYTALSGVAMMELKEMNVASQEYLNELGRERLKAEQDAAAKIAEHNRLAAEEEARVTAEREARQKASPQPITVMPGEPVPDVVRVAAGEIPAPEDDHPLEDIRQPAPDDTIVQRRV